MARAVSDFAAATSDAASREFHAESDGDILDSLILGVFDAETSNIGLGVV